jgi:hypothetical protein
MVKGLSSLVKLYMSLPWEIGDALNAMEDWYGERVYGKIECRLPDSMLYDFARLARQWPPEDRKWDLPWSYYRDCGSDLALARRILAMTAKNGWSREQMRKALREAKK